MVGNAFDALEPVREVVRIHDRMYQLDEGSFPHGIRCLFLLQTNGQGEFLLAALTLLPDELFMTVEERQQCFLLLAIWIARKQDLIEPGQSRRVVVARLTDDPARQSLRPLEYLIVVVERECLQRGSGDDPLAVYLLRGGHIESLQ